VIPRFQGVGRIGADPRVMHTKAGSLVTSIDVVFSEHYNNEEQTVWIKCTAFGKTAEFVSNYFKKGDRIELLCKLNYEQYVDKHGNNRSNVTAIIEKVGFVDSKSQKQQPTKKRRQAPAPQIDVDDDEIPF